MEHVLGYVSRSSFVHGAGLLVIANVLLLMRNAAVVLVMNRPFIVILALGVVVLIDVWFCYAMYGSCGF